MLYDADAGDLDVALAGDLMLTRKFSTARELKFLALRDLLNNADASFANLEGSVRNWDEGTPGITVGTYMTTPPELLDEVKWLGIKIVSCANNHAYDYGEAGLLATIRHLDATGIPHSGSGRNLAEARAPAFLDTPRGRIALVSMTATFRPWNRASAQRPDMRGRPGINPFGFTTAYKIDRTAMRELKRIAKSLGFEKAMERDRRHFYSDRDLGVTDAVEEIALFGHRFVTGDAFAVTATPITDDWNGNLQWIRDARGQADWVIVSFHSHEFGGRSVLSAETRADLEEPAEFAREFAQAAIDAGADMFVGHGSHTLLGIELYKERPIFYSLGNLVFMNETVPFLPQEAYERFGLGLDATPADFFAARTDNDKKGHPSSPKFWQGAVAVCQFKARKLSEVRLHPLDLGHGRSRAQRGRPMLAGEDVTRQIFDRLSRLSAAYGTEIVRQGETAIVSLSS
jgi:poly-gamma-glutamate capsule biosynthesis protein CapA/YwtB (metallophosphatase superfamily)